MYRLTPVKTLATLLIFTFISSFVFAQVTAEMTASKIVVQGEKEVRESADKAKPGEIVEYKVVYKNAGKSAANNVVASLPVPVGMELVPQTPQPAEFTATADGTVYSKLPLKKTVTGPDGKSKEVEVPISEIRGIRWNLGELKVGESKVVVARMRLQSVPVSEPNKSARK